ncbi:MAG: class I SAM-dependent methyltransferase [Pseudomonadota bacterium]|uniref:Ubiquinone/menaquinone biosynthesis C-methylase UbiE n=1 Tax=Actibacterium naphthalenivorans TaxID=1614693 RepID=A0A840CGE5_9RHOB|nr:MULTISPECIES: class I SAM-dependent methyltransferase [Actibacterium]MBB4023172.1 ubiquinone/menaquinone biosynthesis C-methylase UbiE [Actibacterium naphthalenivorans]MDY6860072.1 class I SAM-dependent methyltransferase [Pseudomonadota bacterium]
MRENAQRFDGLAEAYDVYRPGYPPQLFEALAGEMPEGVRCAIDVGAGTGISTRHLLDALGPKWLIIAVEPGADMRRVLSRRFRAVPNVQVLDASGEHLSVPDKSASLVVACTAFHWFDRDRFYAEAARVLIPDGVMAIVRNRRKPDPLIRKFDAFLARHNHEIGDFEQREKRKEPSVRELAALTAFKSPKSRTENWHNRMTCRQLIDLYLTRSTTSTVVRQKGLGFVMDELQQICAAERAQEPFTVAWEATMKWTKKK